MGLNKVIRRLAVVGAYWFGMDALFYRFNQQAKRIVTFHNVLPDDLVQCSDSVGLTLSASEFTSIIDEVSRRFYCSTDFDDARTCTITFDDGYLNQYEVAARILSRRGIPAVIFVAGDVIGKSCPEDALVVDKLILWCQHAPDERARKAFGVFSSRYELFYRYVEPAYMQDVERRGLTVVEKMDREYPFSQLLDEMNPQWRQLRLTGISREQLDRLRQSGWSVGWHTRSHFPLSALDEHFLSEEFDAPMWIDRVVPLSFPYGTLRLVGPRATGVAQAMGFKRVVYNDSFEGGVPECAYSRMTLSEDFYLLHYELSGLKHFMKKRCLLPKNRNERGEML